MIELIARNNDFSEWDNLPRITLKKVDKNGTHYYTDSRCPKCGGTGNLLYYYYVEGGVCFLCGGSGTHPHNFLVRTEEYAKVLEAKRFENNCKKAMKENAKFLEKEGFTPEGKTYIVLGNTYSIRAQLKASGAFFCYGLGWHFNHPVEEFPTKEVSVNQVIGYDNDTPIYLLDTNVFGGYEYHSTHYSYVEAFIDSIQNEYLKSTLPETHWYGEIGQRVTINDCTCTAVTSWQTRFGVTMLYKFTAEDGTIFTWKTCSYGVDSDFVDTGKKISITGTIKAHSEYKGRKETELTRCKIDYKKEA